MFFVVDSKRIVEAICERILERTESATVNEAAVDVSDRIVNALMESGTTNRKPITRASLLEYLAGERDGAILEEGFLWKVELLAMVLTRSMESMSSDREASGTVRACEIVDSNEDFPPDGFTVAIVLIPWRNRGADCSIRLLKETAGAG